jgi:hypothetical protein
MIVDMGMLASAKRCYISTTVVVLLIYLLKITEKLL